MRIGVCVTKILPLGANETGAVIWNHYIYVKRHMYSRHYSKHFHKVSRMCSKPVITKTTTLRTY